MADSGAALLTGGLFSLAVAGISGLVAYHTARSNARTALTASRTTLEGEIRKISEQVRAQEEALERAEIAVLRQRYLTPLRYFAVALSERLAELAAKYGSDENDRVRHWFKTIKDQATRDARRDDFLTWCYYEGLFAATTLYYTCSYFLCANEIRSGQPFATSRPLYSEQLAAAARRGQRGLRLGRRPGRRLGAVPGGHRRAVPPGRQQAHVRADVRGAGRRLAGPAGAVPAAAGLLLGRPEPGGGGAAAGAAGRAGALPRRARPPRRVGRLDADEPARRAPYLRPLDFYWHDLHPDAALRIRAAPGELVSFLDSREPVG